MFVGVAVAVRVGVGVELGVDVFVVVGVRVEVMVGVDVGVLVAVGLLVGVGVGVTGVGGTICPHHVPQRSEPPDGVAAYSWIVHKSMSFTGSTTVWL